MKRVGLLLLTFIIIVTIAKAQEFATDKFNAMTLNTITMEDLFQRDISWAFFKSKMGTPTNEREEVGDENTYKFFDYSGAHFNYSNYLGPFDFREALITSSNYVFTYDGLQIKVGNALSTVSSKFPQAYANRKDGEMYIHHALGDIVMTLYYDNNGLITKIELFQFLL